ncbi:DUF7678 domain-containing protein [Pseudaestuariivita rosea]|uniref:DUF7678 domain-containing protein n=1 Tax=Pseudaestuariivita rosea TaxID=2763263 RepID=UPI001ABAB636|nr:hypothetical protein [Pseudaestuariivita rosea]
MSDDDKRQPANKDSTGQNHKPKNTRSYGASSLTPTGTVAIKGSRQVNITVTNEELPDREVEVDLSRNDIRLEERVKGLNVLLWLEDQPHEKGIDEGRITRMTITKGEIGNEDILVHFDKGEWIQKPENPLETQVMMKVMKEHNGLEMPEVKPAFDQAAKQKIKP